MAGMAGAVYEDHRRLTQEFLEEQDFFPLAPGYFAQKTVIISTDFHILRKDRKEEMAAITCERTAVAWVARVMVLEDEEGRAPAAAKQALPKASQGSSYLGSSLYRILLAEN